MGRLLGPLALLASVCCGGAGASSPDRRPTTALPAPALATQAPTPQQEQQPSDAIGRVVFDRTLPGHECTLTADGLPAMLERAAPLRADDATVTGWQFAPWCAGTLELGGAPWRFRVFLGGLARLDGPDGALQFRLLDLERR